MPAEIDDPQRVLSEASHDLANHIHRSYYFIELLSDAVGPDNAAAGSLLSRLRGSIADIESNVRSTMAFLRPVELRPLRIRMEDLVTSLRRHVGLRPVEISGDSGLAGCEVHVDPARISEVLALLCKAAVGDEDEGAPLRIEYLRGDPVGLRIHRVQQHAGDSRADLGLALIAKIARLHGGALDIEDGPPASLTLRLPVAGR